MRSHVQLPNGILKYFRSTAQTASGRVFYLDLCSGNIGLSGSDRLGTKSGYYSDGVETYLNKEIETPFTTLAARVRSFAENGLDQLTFDKADEETAKSFVAASYSRSKLALDSFMKNSVTAQFFREQTNHDGLVLITTQPGMLVTVLKEYKMHVVINRTNRQLVVPRNCFYEVPSKGLSSIVIPISPFCTLQLATADYRGSAVDGEERKLGYIDDPAVVWEMNKFALRYEYVLNQDFVASASCTELKQLKNYLEANREYLDSLKTSILL